MEERDGNRQVLQYYVAKQDTLLTRISGACNVNVNTLHLGMLVEALENMKDGMLRIRVIDTVAASEMWRGTEWRCHRYDLVPVSRKIWQCLLAVESLQRRVELARDEILCEQLRNFPTNGKVWYCPDPLDKRVRELALVRYIGPVVQLGSGHYFGLELLVNR